MRLNDLLPEAYEYKDEEIPIDLSFDNVLDIFDAIKLVELFEFDRADIGITLLFGENVIELEDIVVVWNDIFDIYINPKEKEVVKYDIAGNPMPSKKTDSDEPAIDLEQDAEYIYASFMQTYKIDLMEQQGKMHWWKFKALLNGLPEDTLIKQIIHIRTYEPSKHDSDEYKEQMRDLQDFYRLEVGEWHEMEE